MAVVVVAERSRLRVRAIFDRRRTRAKHFFFSTAANLFPTSRPLTLCPASFEPWPL